MTCPPFYLRIRGPYQGREAGRPTVYEVTYHRHGISSAVLARCRKFSSAVTWAKRLRTLRKLGAIPIYTQFPGDDAVLLKEG